MQYKSTKKAKQWLDNHFPGNGLSERALRRLIFEGKIPSVPATNRIRLVDVDKLPDLLSKIK